jgi:hypothetical protein
VANNNKKFAVKNGLLTQNIDFISPDEANTIAVTMSNSNVLSVAGTLNATLFDGSAANLANVNASNISSGTLAQARLANASITLNGTTLTLGGTSTITANGSQSLSNGSYLTGGSYNGGTAVTWAVDATSASTASKVVARDTNGSFSANIITANLSGNATTAGTVVTNAQPNITSVGTLSSLAVTANANIGNLNASGKIIASNGGDLILNSSSSGAGEGAQITLAFKGVTGLTGQGNGSWNLDVDGSNNFRVFSVDAGGTARVPLTMYSSNLDVTVNGNAYANYYFGNGSQLSSLTGANVTGTVANATYAVSAGTAGTVTTNAQPNITSVGTLTALTVSGNASAGNVTATQFISTNNGNATNFKVGDDAWLGDVNTSDTIGIRGQQNPSNGYLVFGNADNTTKLGRSGSGPLTYDAAFTATGNVTTVAQLVSSVATGTAPLVVTSTTQVNNLYATRASISDTSTVALGTTGTYYPTFVSATSGNLSETANANFSANFANGYFTATGFVGTHYGAATGLTSIPGANVTGTVANATYAVSAGSATTASKVTASVSGTGNLELVRGDMADNDQFRIMVGGTATNTGFVELATADDGTEPIYVRQYTGVFTNIARTATLLDAGGNTQFPGELTSTRYISNISTGTAPLAVTSTTRVNNLNVAQAGVADSSTITALTTGNYYPTFVNATSGNLAEGSNAVYVANIANGSFAATTFVGALSGTASLATYATTANAVAGANVSGTVANATYAVSAGSATTAGTVTTAAQSNITSVGTLTSLGVSGTVTASTLTSNVATGTAPLTVTSTTRVSNLNVAYANVADFINLTTATTGTYYPIFANAITGNISEVGNANFSANMANGYFTATGFVGNGAALTSLTGANVTGTVANATYAVSAGTAGTVTTNAQPNITSVGTLSSLTVTANTTSGNLATGGELSVTGNAVITGNLTVNGTTIYSNVTTMNIKDPIIELGGTGNANPLTSNDGKDRGEILHVFDVGASAQVDKFIGWDNSNAEFAFGSNVTTTNEVVTFNAFGNVRAGNFIGTHYGAATGLTSIPGANVTGTVANATYAISAGSATTAGTVTTNAQPNITSVGTLTGLTSTGTINLTSASNVSLGPIGNVKITGGSANQILRTDGAGNLSWQSATSTGIQEFTATASQTTFTISGGYIVGTVLVFANGIKLNNADFVATNGTTVVLNEARVVGDIINIVSSMGPTGINNIQNYATAMSIAMSM